MASPRGDLSRLRQRLRELQAQHELAAKVRAATPDPLARLVLGALTGNSLLMAEYAYAAARRGAPRRRNLSAQERRNERRKAKKARG